MIFPLITYIYKRYPLAVWCMVALGIVSAVVDAMSSFIVAPILSLMMQDVTGQNNHFVQKIFRLFDDLGIPKDLNNVLLVFLGFMVVKSFFSLLAKSAGEILRANISYRLKTGIFHQIMHSKWSFFLNENQGQFINSLNTQINQTSNAIGHLVRSIISLFQVVLFTIIACFISFKVTLICVGIAILLAIPFVMIGRFNRIWGEARVVAAGQSNQVIQESFALSKVIVAFANQMKSMTQLKGAHKAYVISDAKTRIAAISISELYYPCGVAALILGMYFARKIGIDFINLSVVLYCLWRMVPELTKFNQGLNTLIGLMPSFLNVVNLEHRSLDHQEVLGAKPFSKLEKGIRLETVSYRYDRSANDAVCEIDILVPKGKMVALVGASGSGKTTVADMMMGFHRATSGSVFIDDVNINDLNLNEYRGTVGYVPQQSVLFNDTIRENLLWANQGASESELIDACRKAHIWSFIESLPDGISTIVGDRGVKLSGGQVQRLAIARAIIRKPELLILDEATSALDSESESMIQRAIESISHLATSVVVAHRLSTIRNSDYIYVLDKGRVVESGNYESLTEKNGYFTDMLNAQHL